MNFKLNLKQKIATALFAFLIVFIPSISQACSCANGTWPNYTYVGEPITGLGDDACNQECANRGAKHFCTNGTCIIPSDVTKTPTNPPATPPGTPPVTPPANPANPQPPSQPQQAFKYVPMEEIPGFGRPGSDVEYIMAIYKFGLWTVGIAAVLMISIGAFMYITSAGNTSQTGKAKEYIFDAIAGVILALTSYLLLYTINPAFVRMGGGDYSSSSGIGGGSGTSSGGGGTGKCEVATTGPCSVENLKKTCFGEEHAAQASAICMGESSGRESLASGDKCQPEGFPVSLGLFQINLSAHNLTGASCTQKTCATSAATPMYTGSNHNCTKGSNYTACVTSATTASCNIETACQLSSNGLHWGAWGANRNCGFPK